jgi:hypothetical protein
MFTQRSVQSVSGGVQLDAHPVGVQRLVAPLHDVVQEVHVEGLVRSASQPSLGLPLQSAHPGSHMPMTHALPLHSACACGT